MKKNKKIVIDPSDLEISSDGKGRFVIINKNTKDVIDDAQGYGYKTKEGANKCLWYLFKGGKDTIENQKNLYLKWKQENKEMYKRIDDILFINFDEQEHEEMIDIIVRVEKEFDKIIPNEVRTYLLKGKF